MKQVLVTGGAGLIGSNLVTRLIKLGYQVVIADNLWRGKLENFYKDGTSVIDLKRHFFELDLRNYENCLKVCRGIDIVYHLADIVAGINFVFANESFVYRANTLMNTNMLAAAIRNGVKKFIYVGTACSYPAEKQAMLNPPPFKEEDVYPANPESSYGWSKLMGEYECDLAQREGLMDIGILRLHNVYGPPCELSPEKSQVISALCRKAINYPDEAFVVWGSGNQKRAFVYVDDAIDALITVSEKGMGESVIQIGPSESISIAEIAEKIVEISGKEIEIKFDTTRPEGDKDRTADWSKAKRVLGWSPQVDIVEGLERTYRWCEKHILRSSNWETDY